jgi:beta-glucosidase
MIGTNNLGQCKDEQPEWTAAGIEKIVATIHQKLPHTKVLLLGVFPREAKNDPFRAKIAEINKAISRLDDGRTTRYLDIGNVFLDANGNIPVDIMPDALHPFAHGYDLWYAAMSPFLTEMLGNR